MELKRQPIVGIKALNALSNAMEHLQEAIFVYNRTADASALKNIQFDVVSDENGTAIRYVVKEHPERGIGLYCEGEV
jgi:hypothetical protein